MQEQISINFSPIVERLKQLEESVSNLQIKEDEVMTNEQVAELLSISTRTLQKLRDDNLIEFSQVGRQIRYIKSDVIAFLKKCKV